MTTHLIVDDSMVNRLLLEALLKRLRQPVVSAAHGAAALGMLQHQEYAMVWMDLEMPLMDGWQTIRSIRSQALHAQLPIVAVSGCQNEAGRLRAFEAGADVFVPKPYSRQQIQDIVQAFLPQPAA